MTIYLSPKHGLNPSLSVCFFCGGEKNEVIIPGLLKGDIEAPRKAVWNHEPCDKCKEYMSMGIMLVSVNEQLTTDMNNPYRSGSICVISEDAAKRFFTGDIIENVLKCRYSYISDEAWDIIGLPRYDKDEPSKV